MVPDCVVCEKKEKQDEKCFGKAKMADKQAANLESCLTKEKKKQLCVSSNYCQEINNDCYGNNNRQDTFGLVGTEFHCMAVCWMTEDEKQYQLEEDHTGTTTTYTGNKRGAINLCHQEEVSLLQAMVLLSNNWKWEIFPSKSYTMMVDIVIIPHWVMCSLEPIKKSICLL